MTPSYLTGLPPLIPLLGFILISLLDRSISKKWIVLIGCGSVLVSLIISGILFFTLQSMNQGEVLKFHAFDWFSVGSLRVTFDLVVDPLSVFMMLIITGVGFLIHVYSIGYMKDDPDHHRFFAYLNLFIFFMLILVMGSNLLILFIGWEGVGLSSYLLIGFWYSNTAFNNAARKAFIMNRIGDLGLILGIFLVFFHFGTLEFSEITAQAGAYPAGTSWITTITLLLFIGAIGKSAQIPLHTWLPDAMAGPTPVSALIHAATMVTAGIYLIARNQLLFSLSPLTLNIVIAVGLGSSLIAALIAIKQNDIKKILAYSTISQLGLMFVAHGVQAYSSGMFHMLTHAFFKALLFLGAGSVIHAMDGEQDIRKMGGLKSYLPLTWITFLIGTLTISGLPPFAGFFSKDEILIHTFQHNKWIWVIASVSSFLTAFYMFRLFFLTFNGSSRLETKHIHESPVSMTFPLLVLAALSALGGLINIPAIFQGSEKLDHFLAPLPEGIQINPLSDPPSHAQELILMGIAVSLSLIAIGLAFRFYVIKSMGTKILVQPSGFFTQLVIKKFYFDEIYDAVLVRPLRTVSNFIFRFIDQKLVNQVVNDYGFVVSESSKRLRFLQSGNMGYYILFMVIGMICILLSTMLVA